MVMPKKGHVKLVVYVDPKVKAEISAEARRRKETMGFIVEEAYSSRVILVRKEKAK